MSKTTISSKLTILPPINKNTETNNDLFDTQSNYITILTSQTPVKKQLKPIIRPSRMWCEKGILDKENGEIYNQELHNGGFTAYKRCRRFYNDYKNPKWNIIKSGGKNRTIRHKKNKKTRKQRRRSLRRR
jgi:alpha-mannosidase